MPSGTILSLQRTIGNQATRRILDKETLRRQQHSSIQRAAVDTDVAASIGKEARPALSFWAGKNKDEEAEKNEVNIIPGGVSQLDFSTVTPEAFKKSRTLQATIFKLATAAVTTQFSKAQAAVSSSAAKGAEISALKKGKQNTVPEFAKGVIEKCEKKPYATLQEMNDIARGRVNVNNEDDMEKIAANLKVDSQTSTPPRRTKDGVTKYPRWHVITNDPTGLTFEWQIGTKATTTLYEKKGIKIPPLLRTAAAAAKKELPETADIHDISYAVFSQMASSKDPATVAAAEEYKVPEFVDKVNRTSHKSGKLGQSNPEFQKEIDSLLEEADNLLSALVDGGKSSLLVKLLH